MNPTITLQGYQCARCGHQWVPRNKGEEPTICPKCKSPYWNRARKHPKSSAKKK